MHVHMYAFFLSFFFLFFLLWCRPAVVYFLLLFMPTAFKSIKRTCIADNKHKFTNFLVVLVVESKE